MAYSFRHTEPELSGVIIKEFVKCGKVNCWCASKEGGHGEYSYLYWREDGILRKRYIPSIEATKIAHTIKQAKTEDKFEKSILSQFMKFN